MAEMRKGKIQLKVAQDCKNFPKDCFDNLHLVKQYACSCHSADVDLGNQERRDASVLRARPKEKMMENHEFILTGRRVYHAS